MSKRVYELGKELGLSSRDVIAALGAMGVVAKSHSSTIEEPVAQRLREAAAAGALRTGVSAPARPARRPAPKRSALERPPAERAPVRRVAQAKAPAVQATPAPAAAPAATGPAPAGATGESAVPPAPAAARLSLHRGITVQELAGKLSVGAAEILKKLLMLGEMATLTQSLSDEAVQLICHERGVEAEIVSPDEETSQSEDEAAGEEAGEAAERPPVITVMGHVDHGKTLLLDRIRKTDVVAQEAGGITQHIGAYRVHRNERSITFIDTPGHEAFTQMRARGARVTDIAVLVVAADDGVKPQTVEAISHARAAGVPIVVAVNKVDKPEADPTRVRQQLTEQGLIPEEWGGDTVCVDVSAKAGTNLEQLLEMLLLVADVQELKANASVRARGVALEAHLDRGRGPVATLLVQRGTLRVGDAIVCGGAWCKVRAMLDENGRKVDEAPPGTPAQVLGFSLVPAAGDEFRAAADERTARHVAQDRLAKQRAAELVIRKRVTLEDLTTRISEGEVSELNVILKADVQGSLEAIDEALSKIRVGDVTVRVLHKAAGAITENDVTLAEASGAIVIGFNVRPDSKARALADAEKVDVRTYQIIYKLVEDVEAALKGMLKPEFVESVLGRAQVRNTFKIPKGIVIAGSYVEDGTMSRGARARLLRDGVIVADTTVSSLRRFKDDVREVAAGYECGIGLEGFQDVKVGDVLEAYEIREVPRA
ncbi:MAG: translation initiation factor IF-2 [Acidobacteria bacterium]|nr:translation initiation factor IF-2 [Acidobacteriota bacterium]